MPEPTDFHHDIRITVTSPHQETTGTISAWCAVHAWRSEWETWQIEHALAQIEKHIRFAPLNFDPNVITAPAGWSKPREQVENTHRSAEDIEAEIEEAKRLNREEIIASIREEIDAAAVKQAERIIELRKTAEWFDNGVITIDKIPSGLVAPILSEERKELEFYRGVMESIKDTMPGTGIWCAVETLDGGDRIVSVHPSEIEALRAINGDWGVARAMFVPWGLTVHEAWTLTQNKQEEQNNG